MAQFSRIQGCGGEEKKRVRDRLCDILRQGIRRTFFFLNFFFFQKKKKKGKKAKRKIWKKKSDRYRGSIPRPHGWIKDNLPVRLDTLWKLHDQYYIWTTTFSIFSSKLQTALSPLGSPPHTPGFYWTWPHLFIINNYIIKKNPVKNRFFFIEFWPKIVFGGRGDFR